jgi:hypothetical protein
MWALFYTLNALAFSLSWLCSLVIITEDNKKERLSFTFFIGLKNKITRWQVP